MSGCRLVERSRELVAIQGGDQVLDHQDATDTLFAGR